MFFVTFVDNSSSSFAANLSARTAPELNRPFDCLTLKPMPILGHGIDIVEHLDEGLPDVVGDAHQLQQVFLNILNNAYDAVHEVGRPARIEIMSTKSGNSVEVSFRDNGNGISNPDRIFFDLHAARLTPA